MKKNIFHEITPLAKEDFFVVLYNQNAKFDFPTHYHAEYELNYVETAKGVRIVGDSTCNYDGYDLVLTGPDVYHSWQSEAGGAELVITIQFQKDIFPLMYQNKRLFLPIRDLLERSQLGVEFSQETIFSIAPKIKALVHESHFDSFLSFLGLLNEMAISENQKVLCSQKFSPEIDQFKSRRIKLACEFIHRNYQNKIRIDELAALTKMAVSSFSHFFKKRTGKSFLDYLNDVRVGHAAVKLIETTISISEVCYSCGFNNISNFNRLFKERKALTPSEFRKLNQQQILKY